MATKGEAQQALLDKIAEVAPTMSSAKSLNDLAEAWAWLANPSQPHGGSTQTSVSK